jgi:hypothetical protein
LARPLNVGRSASFNPSCLNSSANTERFTNAIPNLRVLASVPSKLPLPPTRDSTIVLDPQYRDLVGSLATDNGALSKYQGRRRSLACSPFSSVPRAWLPAAANVPEARSVNNHRHRVRLSWITFPLRLKNELDCILARRSRTAKHLHLFTVRNTVPLPSGTAHPEEYARKWNPLGRIAWLGNPS